MLRVLIADGTDDFRNGLMERLRGVYYVHTSRDGLQTLELMRSFVPDVLVLDLMLPGLDGITLLRKAVCEGMCPMVLATTRFLSEYVLESLEELGVGYIMVKPCDMDAVAERIGDLSEHLRPSALSQPDMKTLVSNLLLSLNVPTKLRGYSCLREAIQLLVSDPTRMITKEVYPIVAQRCGGTGLQVERAIRNAIGSAWIKRDEQVWRLYFQPEGDGFLHRPTNGAFMTRLADHLLLEQEPAVSGSARGTGEQEITQ